MVTIDYHVHNIIQGGFIRSGDVTNCDSVMRKLSLIEIPQKVSSTPVILSILLLKNKNYFYEIYFS